MVFRIIPLTNVSNIAKKAKKTSSDKKFKVRPRDKPSALDLKFAHIVPVAENFVFPTNEDSIQEVLDRCHHEVKMFINNNEPNSFKASPNTLDITFKNKYRMSIQMTEKYARRIIIKDNRRKVIYDGMQRVTLEDVKRSQYA